jgi:hypothetical protein
MIPVDYELARVCQLERQSEAARQRLMRRSSGNKCTKPAYIFLFGRLLVPILVRLGLAAKRAEAAT